MELGLFLFTVLPLSLWFWSLTVLNSSKEMTQLISPVRWLLSIAGPIVVGYHYYCTNSLTLSGLLVGLVIGFVLTLSNYCFAISLLTFIMISSIVINYKSRIKCRMEEHYKEGGQRNWVQMVCSGGVATQLSLCYLMESGCEETPINFITDYNKSWFAISVLGSLCCANGDICASELGSVLAKSSYLITTLKRVPKRTNGGVSAIGLVFSALGGIAIGFGFLVTFYFLLLFGNAELYVKSPPQWPIIIIGLFGGLLGSLTDSLMGATLQYSGFNRLTHKVVQNGGNKCIKHISGIYLLNNDSVDLVSTLITALVLPNIAIYLWTYF